MRTAGRFCLLLVGLPFLAIALIITVFHFAREFRDDFGGISLETSPEDDRGAFLDRWIGRLRKFGTRCRQRWRPD